MGFRVSWSRAPVLGLGASVVESLEVRGLLHSGVRNSRWACVAVALRARVDFTCNNANCSRST